MSRAECQKRKFHRSHAVRSSPTQPASRPASSGRGPAKLKFALTQHDLVVNAAGSESDPPATESPIQTRLIAPPSSAAGTGFAPRAPEEVGPARLRRWISRSSRGRPSGLGRSGSMTATPRPRRASPGLPTPTRPPRPAPHGTAVARPPSSGTGSSGSSRSLDRAGVSRRTCTAAFGTLGRRPCLGAGKAVHSDPLYPWSDAYLRPAAPSGSRSRLTMFWTISRALK